MTTQVGILIKNNFTAE